MRRFKNINLAILSKIGWWLATGSDKLWSQALKAKYFPNTTFMKCKRKSSQLCYWKGILSTRHLLSKCVCFWVRKENYINFWEDPWVSNLENFIPKPRQKAFRNFERMVDFVFLPNGIWNTKKLEDLFDDNLVTNISNIFWANCMCPDKVIWLGEGPGSSR